MAQTGASRESKNQLVEPWLKLCYLGIAFLAGWVVMMLEIVGGRMLAPYFGYSIYQWGALIGVVLAALSCGYYIGGRMGDTPYALAFLMWSLIISAVSILLVPLVVNAFLPQFRGYGPAWGAVAASAMLLGTPSVLLAVVSPIVIRLTTTSKLANTAGVVYAISTLGSLGGTFFAAFYAIPTLGTRISYYIAGVLVIVSVLGIAVTRKRLPYAASAALLGLVWLPSGSKTYPGLVYQDESIHNIIQVLDTGTNRFLYLNYTHGSQTVMPKDELLTNSYYDYFLLGPRMNDGKKTLFLGAAGGVALKQLVIVYPDVEVVGVELDPKVIDVAERYFGLADHPRIRLVEADARWYVETTPDLFDVIVIDLYVTGHIPFFTTTKEFFEQVKHRLTDRGVLMMNILSIQPGEELIAPFIRTVGSVFPSVFLIGSGNFILVASKATMNLSTMVQNLEKPGASPIVRRVVDRAIPNLRVAVADARWPIFTDDLNDVEFRTFKMLHGRY
jgi:spermidine synthase